MSLARIIIAYDGPADCMPWNSSKTGINFNHDLFRAVRTDILEAVRNATALSKRLQPNYDKIVKPYKSGKIISRELKATEHIKASKLPPLPRIRKSPQNAIKEANREIGIQKPWTVAAYEGVIAVEAIKRQRTLSQKNRILLIVIDSTLEIAFKDYLAHEVAQPLGESKLVNLFSNRIDVHKEVSKTVAPKKKGFWKSLDYFYRKRCELVHKRASIDVSDEEIATFQANAEEILEKMYSLKFPKD